MTMRPVINIYVLVMARGKQNPTPTHPDLPIQMTRTLVIGLA
jgi:hypothetical protein